ncbi:hypothetical protein CRUP_004739, partial [Coryphaenoides rupestris]
PPPTGKEEHDKEGRVITAEFPTFFLVTAYIPNSGRGLVRLDYRKTWDVDFRAYLSGLEQRKPLVLCGDLNVAHEEVDLKNPKGNKKNAGFTAEEREGFGQLLAAGFTDSFRHLYPERAYAYTFWTYMMNSRSKNVGWRLDYFVLSAGLMPGLCDSKIRNKAMGSDHCPITLLLVV